MTDAPTPLLEPGFVWMHPDGRPTADFYKYMLASDRAMRAVVGFSNIPETPLPDALWDISLIAAASDEIVALTTGVQKATLRLVGNWTGMEVRANLKTAQTSGTKVTVDINRNGTTILSTKLTIDNSSRTSVGASVAAVISDTDWNDDDEFTFDIDGLGDGTANGLKVALIGRRVYP